MRQVINDNELENVVGGTTYLVANKNAIIFDTLNKGYRLHNCSFEEAKRYLAELYVDNSHLSETDFDQLARKSFATKGWINF